MAISLLKRYKNEINFLIKTTEKHITSYVTDDLFDICFNVSSPYLSSDYDNSQSGDSYVSMQLGISQSLVKSNYYKNRIRAIEDNGLVYIGIDLNKEIIKRALDFYFNEGYIYGRSYYTKDLDGFIIGRFISNVIDVYESAKFKKYFDKYGSLKSYNKPLLLGDIEEYATNKIYVNIEDDGTYTYYGYTYWENGTENYLSKNTNKIKNLEYFKVCKRAVEDLYSNLNISLADGEFPKLSNRNFLPIVTVDFNKDEEVSFLSSGKYVGKSSYPMYSKGLMKLDLFFYLEKYRHEVYPKTNTLKIEYGGKECRVKEGEIDIDFSVN